MPSILLNQANLTASTKTANLLAGSIFEFLNANAQVNVYAVSSAGGIRMQVMADSQTVVDDNEIVTIGTTLIDKDHLITTFNAYAGTRLSLFLRETAAAGTTDVLLKIEVNYF